VGLCQYVTGSGWDCVSMSANGRGWDGVSMSVKGRGGIVYVCQGQGVGLCMCQG